MKQLIHAQLNGDDMHDFPLQTTTTQEGTFLIKQHMMLGDVQDFIQIEMSSEQAARLVKELKAFIKEQKDADSAPVATDNIREQIASFEQFWAAYPSENRCDKDGLRMKWIRRNLHAISDLIMTHVRQMSEKKWRENGGKFVPLITTYVNQSRWEAGTGSGHAFTMPSV